MTNRSLAPCSLQKTSYCPKGDRANKRSSSAGSSALAPSQSPCGGAKFKTYESFVGRLEHAATIIPHSCYFLNRIRGRKKGKRHFQFVKLTKTTTADIRLWLLFLAKARDGISINLLTTRQPTHILFSNSFPGGLSGYSITSGKCWQLELDPSRVDPEISNNLLEFIAAVVQVWITVKFDSTDCPPLSCILAWTDSSSSASWLHKSNFDENTSTLHETVARKCQCINLLPVLSACLYPGSGTHSSQ